MAKANTAEITRARKLVWRLNMLILGLQHASRFARSQEKCSKLFDSFSTRILLVPEPPRHRFLRPPMQIRPSDHNTKSKQIRSLRALFPCWLSLIPIKMQKVAAISGSPEPPRRGGAEMLMASDKTFLPLFAGSAVLSEPRIAPASSVRSIKCQADETFHFD